MRQRVHEQSLGEGGARPAVKQLLRVVQRLVNKGGVFCLKDLAIPCEPEVLIVRDQRLLDDRRASQAQDGRMQRDAPGALHGIGTAPCIVAPPLHLLQHRRPHGRALGGRRPRRARGATHTAGLRTQRSSRVATEAIVRLDLLPTMSLDTFDPNQAQNLPEIEKQIAVRCVEHAQTYWNLLEKVRGSALRLTK